MINKQHIMTQHEALNILKTGANVFLTGEPGSGKTFVINEYVRYLKKSCVDVAVTASTGIAATHLGGMTLHSWSGIGIKDFLTSWDLDRIASNERIVKRVSRAKVLVIDEISMLDGRILEIVNQVCSAIKRKNEPFGGMQVVFVGDFFQLPPVAREGGPPQEFAFNSKAWQATSPMICYLSEQHRQEDTTFLEILSALRQNKIAENHCTHFYKRCIRDIASLPKGITKLFSHNENVDRINAQELECLPGKAQIFSMRSSGKDVLVEQLKRGCLSPEKLSLKINALVMFTKNNPTGVFVNGTLGRVIGFEEFTHNPVVKTRNGNVITAEPMDWNIEEHDRVLATISQIPLRLAWAITIHKSQGMSLDAAFIDLRDAFVEGQGYVALSRVRTLTGLYLAGWNEIALTVHSQVLAIDEEFRTQSLAARAGFAKIHFVELNKMHNNFVQVCGGKIIRAQETSYKHIASLGKAYSVETLRAVHPNAYRGWSDDEDKNLAIYFEEGLNIKTMASMLGRQPGAIRSRLTKIGLAK